jgi:hypothetical protein
MDIYLEFSFSRPGSVFILLSASGNSSQLSSTADSQLSQFYEPNIKHRPQQYINRYVRNRCREKMFTKPLPSN